MLKKKDWTKRIGYENISSKADTMEDEQSA